MPAKRYLLTALAMRYTFVNEIKLISDMCSDRNNWCGGVMGWQGWGTVVIGDGEKPLQGGGVRRELFILKILVLCAGSWAYTYGLSLVFVLMNSSLP